MGHVVISIIVPVYNIEQYLDRCIASLVEQTYGSIEIILVDDGSEDYSGEICEKWAEKCDKVRVFHISNHGVSYARNLGIEKSRGQYLLFVDGDDWIDKDMVFTLKNIMEETQSDIVLCDVILECENGASLALKNYKTQSLNFNEKCAEEILKLWTPWAKLYKKDIIEAIRFPLIKYAEDLMFNYQLIVEGRIRKIAITDRGMYHYFQRENSAMHKGFNEEWYISLRKEIEVAENLENKFHKMIRTNLVKNGTQLFLCGYANSSLKTMINKRKIYRLYRKEVKGHKEYIFFNIDSFKEKMKLFVIVYCPIIYVILKKAMSFLEGENLDEDEST